MEQSPLPAGPRAHINLGALADNAARIVQHVHPRGLLAVVKWDAYGHGLVPCAVALDRAGASAFGVSSPRDGVTLRRAGIEKPILVMTDWVGKPPSLFLDWNLEAAATSWYKVEYLEAVSRRLGRSIPAHVKFDTGLGRVGIHHSEAERALRKIAQMGHLNVVGIYSHLAYGGPTDDERGRNQIEIFERIVRLAESLGIEPRWVHLANSAAAMALPDVPGNLVRAGIALYGQPPSADVHRLLPLEPVMTLVGTVNRVRRVRRGRGFPSPHFWTAPSDGWGAEIALGSRVNYPAALAGKAPVLIGGRRHPLVGVVSSEASFAFTGTHMPHVGDEAVFWGRQAAETVYLFELAPLIGALPYELPTWLSPRLERVFTQTDPPAAPASTSRV